MRRSALIAIGLGAAALGVYVASRSKVEEMINNVFSSKEEFVRRLWIALGSASMQLNRPEIGTVQKTILIGQAIHESGWGVGKAAKRAFNYWNITAGKLWKGPVLIGPDTEFATVDDPSTPVDETKVPKNIWQKFRLYKSDNDGVIDILRFIGPGTRYKKAWDALVKGDAMDYAKELHAAGFYTQPLEKYQAGLRAGIKTVVQILG